MLKRTLIAILSLAAAGAVCAQAYKWVDENGITQYADRPAPDAVRIELPKQSGQRTRISRPVTNDSARNQETPTAAPSGYQSLSVASPLAEETLWNIGGVLTVSLNLRPALKPGHRVRVYFDGEPQFVPGITFRIPEVFRGVHNIQAEIIDQTGQPQILSQTNRFYVQQNSVVNNRARRN